MIDTFSPIALAAAGGGGLFLTGEDHLRLTTFGGVANLVVVLEGRLVGIDGHVVPIAEQQVPNSDYTAKRTIFPLAAGVLTHVQLRIGTGSAGRGGVFAVLEIVRGTVTNAQPLGTLLQGYATTNARLAWPGSPIESSVSGPGRMRSILGADPAAGLEISETVPAGVRWRLVSLSASLVNNAVVANRQASLLVDDGATTLFQTGDGLTQTASQTIRHSWADGLGTAGNFNVAVIGPLPRATMLGPGFRIRTSTTGIDPGDNWGPPQYLVEEWIE